MKTITFLLFMLFCAGCTYHRADQFFLTERHSGHRFGPFQCRTGEEVVISGKRFRLSKLSVTDQHAALIQKMKAVILPTVDFRQANIHDVIEFLATSGNVTLVLSLNESTTPAYTPDPFGAETADTSLPVITFQANDVSVYDTLNIVSELADLKWSIENSVVMIRGPEEAQDEDYPEKWVYDGSFHDLIDVANKIVIRNGGFNCCSPVDDDTVLLSITNAQEIAAFNSLLQFETNQTWNACMCCGYPGIDWYRGRHRLALTGLQHGHALRWKGFTGDAFFTKASSQRLAQWLIEHGIPDPHQEFKKLAENEKTANN